MHFDQLILLFQGEMGDQIRIEGLTIFEFSDILCDLLVYNVTMFFAFLYLDPGIRTLK